MKKYYYLLAHLTHYFIFLLFFITSQTNAMNFLDKKSPKQKKKFRFKKLNLKQGRKKIAKQYLEGVKESCENDKGKIADHLSAIIRSKKKTIADLEGFKNGTPYQTSEDENSQDIKQLLENLDIQIQRNTKELDIANIAQNIWRASIEKKQ